MKARTAGALVLFGLAGAVSGVILAAYLADQPISRSAGAYGAVGFLAGLAGGIAARRPSAPAIDLQGPQR